MACSGLVCSVLHVTPVSAAQQLLCFSLMFSLPDDVICGAETVSVCVLFNTSLFYLNKNVYTTFLYKQTT